jgi:hypothetical protein
MANNLPFLSESPSRLEERPIKGVSVDDRHHPNQPEEQAAGSGDTTKRQEERTILINFVLDKSGSMERIREATIAGFNQFLADQKREGGSAVLTLTCRHALPDCCASSTRHSGPSARPAQLCAWR